jgi:hypothetical protein
MPDTQLDNKKLIVISIFCIAMAGLEGAVVVYLRALYYPDGFSVILKIIDLRILLVEIVRELTTVIMLAAIAYLVGNSFRERFAYFLLCFGIWDIFYYVWLKIFINWPVSLLEWDILFLIPITWLGPVLAPVICSITMIVLSMVILKYPQNVLSKTTFTLLIVGSLIILFTFMKDYGALIMEFGFSLDPEFIEAAKAKIPQPYSWVLFIIGEAVLITATMNHRYTKY